jgi:hypothetical protein
MAAYGARKRIEAAARAAADDHAERLAPIKVRNVLGLRGRRCRCHDSQQEDNPQCSFHQFNSISPACFSEPRRCPSECQVHVRRRLKSHAHIEVQRIGVR